MKTIIYYYSITGNNKQLAEIIQKELNCDIEELKDKFSGYKSVSALMTIGGMHGTLKLKTKIEKLKNTPDFYDQVILVGPVWAWHLFPAGRAFLTDYKDYINSLSIAVVCGGGKKYRQNVINDVNENFGKKLIADIVISEAEFKRTEYNKEFSEFIAKIKLI